MPLGPAYVDLEQLKSDVDLATTVGLVLAAVSGTIVIADSSNLDHADRLIGISIGEDVVTAGKLDVPGPWNVGDVLFLGSAGELTDVVPTSGFQQQVAVATGPTSVVVSLGNAIILS